MKRIVPAICCLLFALTGCGPTAVSVPESVVIEGVTYRTGFYGYWHPYFYDARTPGAQALHEEQLYSEDDEEEKYTFQRVENGGHDWVYRTIGRAVYCAEDEWEELCAYYADPQNYQFYLGDGHTLVAKTVALPEVDLDKFNELLLFGEENGKDPFSNRQNNRVLEYAQRIPYEAYTGDLVFYMTSNDGFFYKANRTYFIYAGKLFLLFHHDHGRDNGGVKETVGVEVPQELGQYFIDLAEEYLPYLS